MEEQIPQPEQKTDLQNSSSQIQNSASSKSASTILYKGLAVFVIILVVLGGYILFAHNKKRAQDTIYNTVSQQPYQGQGQSAATITPAPTLAVPSVSASNADQTLGNTDTNIQQSLNQVNSDLNDYNSVDKTQDNPNSL